MAGKHFKLCYSSGTDLDSFGFLMRRMGGGAMGVGKSTAKVYVEKTTGVTFKDVAGQDEAKESLQEVVDFCIIRRNTAISGQSSRRGHFLSDLLEPVRHCWQKQLPERQRFRFSPWQVLILWRCSSAWVLPVCVICSRKRRRWHRVLFY